ncbi:CPBP family intramembrane glutamic endopeptidase [Salinimicrobium soli]|uniref:CPBP family intramembrane glutamic endopeptidase n=1 Tax=Salinimicrobium soli TaxID=1254399 RepID=UPI003AB0D750
MDLSFKAEDLQVFIPVVIGLLSFLIFWFAQQSNGLRKRFILKYGEEKGSARFILYTRYLGGITMGLLPAAVYLILLPSSNLEDLGLLLKSSAAVPVAVFAFGMILILFPLVYMNAKKPKNLLVYPQIRSSEWDRKLVGNNLLSWAVYLLGYEMLFRGVLLFPLVAAFGVWPAIAINIGLYSATHIPKGSTETFGAFPFSVVLCLICLYTGNFWVAFIAHLTMAWTNAWFSLKHNPQMKIIKT